MLPRRGFHLLISELNGGLLFILKLPQDRNLNAAVFLPSLRGGVADSRAGIRISGILKCTGTEPLII
ncbi:hypothetical protein D3C86_1960830 [compost metagenome]